MLLTVDPALGAQPERDEVHPRARARAAVVRDAALRARRRDLRRARRSSPSERCGSSGGTSPVLLAAAVLLWVNQVCFVLALDATTASTIGLLIGTIPIFAALFGVALGRERLSARFWAAAAISSVGVSLVADRLGRRRLGRLRRHPARPRHGGDLGGVLGRRDAAHADVLAVARQRRRDRRRLGSHRARRAPASRPRRTGTSGGRSGRCSSSPRSARSSSRTSSGSASSTGSAPPRATLAANLQPFVAAVLAVILLSETLGLAQIAGGALIAVGIVVARRRTAPAQAA